MLTDLQRNELWKFVRGEVEQQAFEYLIYFDPAYEAGLAPDLYTELAWTNFDDPQQVDVIRRKLRIALAQHEPCCCAQIPRFGQVQEWEIYPADDWLATLVFVEDVGPSKRRVILTKCLCCDGNWIMSSSTSNASDIIFVQNLSDADADLILIGGDMAEDMFTRYVAMTGVDAEETDDLNGIKYDLAETWVRKHMGRMPQITVDELARKTWLNDVDPVRLKMLRDHVAANPSAKDTSSVATKHTRSILARAIDAAKSMFIIGR